MEDKSSRDLESVVSEGHYMVLSQDDDKDSMKGVPGM